MGDALGAEAPAEDVSIQIVEPTFDVQEERGDLAARALESADCIDYSSACVERGDGGEGATLVGVQETYVVATAESLEAAILSRILETVWRRTMILNEDGESQEGLPGLPNTTRFAFLREEG